jgi:hypothetical protein
MQRSREVVSASVNREEKNKARKGERRSKARGKKRPRSCLMTPTHLMGAPDDMEAEGWEAEVTSAMGERR